MYTEILSNLTSRLFPSVRDDRFRSYGIEDSDYYFDVIFWRFVF